MKNIVVRLDMVTPEPLKVVCEAAKLTMVKDYKGFKEDLDKLNSNIPRKLVEMNHTSLFEHIVMRFMIIGASRAFLTQVTRHRIASFTSGSQHYQDHENFSYIYPYGLKDTAKYDQFMDTINSYYKYLKNVEGLPKEEARYILPNACTNNLEITINARSLLNFFNLRLCNRNVREMRLVACQMFKLANKYFPELFNFDLAGPDCTISKCHQNLMQCSNNYFELI